MYLSKYSVVEYSYLYLYVPRSFNIPSHLDFSRNDENSTRHWGYPLPCRSSAKQNEHISLYAYTSYKQVEKRFLHLPLVKIISTIDI